MSEEAPTCSGIHNSDGFCVGTYCPFFDDENLTCIKGMMNK